MQISETCKQTFNEIKVLDKRVLFNKFYQSVYKLLFLLFTLLNISLVYRQSITIILELSYVLRPLISHKQRINILTHQDAYDNINFYQL